MPFSLPDTLALLARTPASLNTLLRDLPQSWTHANEGPETWSPFEVIGHLLHCEQTDWLPRLRSILASPELRPLPPFDRFGHIPLCQTHSLPALLDAFAAARAAGLQEIASLNLTQSQLALQGIHPIFGTVSASNLLATWAVHDLTHIHQISRVLAFQYRHAVGPWEQYLTVLKPKQP